MGIRTENKVERKTVKLESDLKKFMPNLLWVLKARSTDDNRYLLNFLNIDDNGFCCTDGRRLHLCKDKESLPNGLENGLYQVNICKNVIMFIPKEGYFPKYMEVIPQYEGEGINVNLEVSKHDSRETRLSIALTKIVRLMTKDSLNMEYLKDLLGYTWTVNQKEDKAIKFVSGDNLAIVMPLRMES